MTAVNDQGGEINKALDVDGGEDTIPRTMQKYKERGEGWMLVVDDNCGFLLSSLQMTNTSNLEMYLSLMIDGEGSAREHAALQPRFYGCELIIARSFARIHETNLKVCFVSRLCNRTYTLVSGSSTPPLLPSISAGRKRADSTRNKVSSHSGLPINPITRKYPPTTKLRLSAYQLFSLAPIRQKAESS